LCGTAPGVTSVLEFIVSFNFLMYLCVCVNNDVVYFVGRYEVWGGAGLLGRYGRGEPTHLAGIPPTLIPSEGLDLEGSLLIHIRKYYPVPPQYLKLIEIYEMNNKTRL
jgi:hypothetical protein